MRTNVGASGRKHVEIRRSRVPAGLKSVGAMLVVSIWVASAVLIVAMAGTSAGMQPAVTTGDYIYYHCTNSVITAGGVTVCNNQASAVVDRCGSGYCGISVSDSPLSGHGFQYWLSSGDAFYGCASGGCVNGCSTQQSSLLNPDTLCMSVPNPGVKYAGDVTAHVS